MFISEENKRAFGLYLAEKIKDSNLSKKEICDKIGISSSYLVDIVKGNRKAPLKHLKALESIFLFSEEDKNTFYDLAYQTHGNHLDINKYLEKNPAARLAIRLAQDKNMSGDEFLSLVLNFKKDNNNEEDLEK